MDILKVPVETMLKKIKCDSSFVDAMIYNVCDYTDKKKCPLNKQKCNGQCSVNFEEVKFKKRKRARK